MTFDLSCVQHLIMFRADKDADADASTDIILNHSEYHAFILITCHWYHMLSQHIAQSMSDIIIYFCSSPHAFVYISVTTPKV